VFAEVPVQRVKPADLQGMATLAKSGRHAELEATARRLLKRHPKSGVTTQLLALALWSQGKDALPYLQRATELLPNDAEAHGNLGNALRAAGQLEAAVRSQRRALEITPGYAEAHNNLGSALLDLGLLEEASASFRQAAVLKPTFALAHSNLANVLVQQDQLEEAAASCRRALELNPALTGAIVQLAELEAAHGRFAAAEDLLRRALAIEPDMPEAWAGLVRWRKLIDGDPAWLAAAERVVGLPLAPRRESHLRFALGKYFDDVAEYDRAFQHYRRANELAKVGVAPYDPVAVTRAIDRLIASHDRPWLDQNRTNGDGSERAVFIVGMPRSGTTLVEQMLASHGAVFGAGELSFWARAAAQYRTPSTGNACERAVLEPLAADYLSGLRRLSGAAPRVVDKMPGNFMYLGLIHAALPHARIIHLRRSALDTCVSIYFQNFGAGHAYAHDLDDLAHYYAGYVRVMDHWRSTLPPAALLDVAYEDLVHDPEGSVRRMLEFIELPWDPKCLEFHRNARTVSTLSKWQARQPISSASVGRWRHYENFVAPLRRLAQA
jgi:tetratricopeptide (TPR) repeat protein